MSRSRAQISKLRNELSDARRTKTFERKRRRQEEAATRRATKKAAAGPWQESQESQESLDSQESQDFFYGSDASPCLGSDAGAFSDDADDDPMHDYW